MTEAQWRAMVEKCDAEGHSLIMDCNRPKPWCLNCRARVCEANGKWITAADNAAPKALELR